MDRFALMVVDVRFQVTQVMDAIEQRLTTDITGAQAVVDLGEVVRQVELDHGRSVNLVRIGMVVDAMSRYLIDGGAMLYGVVERGLLSEAALTSKERMVLSRWADDGLIEATPVVADRVVEIADLTGLPLIAVRPYPELVTRFGWLDDGSGRVLRLTPRGGVAVLTPMLGASDGAAVLAADDPAALAPAVGRAKVPVPADQAAEGTGDEPAGEVAGEVEAEASTPAEPQAAEPEPAVEPAEQAEAAEPVDGELPVPIEVFTGRGALRAARVRVSRHRHLRAEPNQAHTSVLTRHWRCDGFDCPAFGERRQIGQPVPRLRDELPVCPRHDQPVVDAGPRPPAYAVSIVIDDLPRQRLVVRGGQPVSIGRADDDPDVISVGRWLHQAAAAWISPVHLRLEAGQDGLTVIDLSERGTMVWQRKGPDERGSARALHRESHTLGEWESVELYTGIELIHGDRRLVAMLGQHEPASVLLDAPTAAHRQLSPG